MFFGRLSERFGWKFLVFIAILIGMIVALFFLSEKERNAPFVPPEFLEARTKTGFISENIVEIASASIENLHNIRKEDVAGDHAKALALVSEEIERNELARQEALKLSGELAQLARQIERVRPEEAAQVGLQAALYGTQITQHLINYNAYTNELLGTLRSSFASGTAGEEATSAKVQELIDKMNTEAEAVNRLNGEYKRTMGEFDTLTRAE